MPEPLPIACDAFTAGAEPSRNAEHIAASIDRAAERGARLLLTPECALSGYPGAARDGLDDCDWAELGKLEQELSRRAERAGLALLLGSVARDADGGYGNEALFCGACDDTRRYRKRCLTPLDERCFAAADEPCLVELDGWRLGLTICYDLRFPDCWAELALAGADAFCNIAHMAGPDPDPGCKATVVPAHCASRSAELATPLIFCNTAAADRWVDSGVWDARGLRIASTADGLLRVDVPARSAHDPWYTGIREHALKRWSRRLGR